MQSIFSANGGANIAPESASLYPFHHSPSPKPFIPCTAPHRVFGSRCALLSGARMGWRSHTHDMCTHRHRHGHKSALYIAGIIYYRHAFVHAQTFRYHQSGAHLKPEPRLDCTHSSNHLPLPLAIDSNSKLSRRLYIKRSRSIHTFDGC